MIPKTFSGIFYSNKGNQPIALLDFAQLLPLKVKGNFYVLELLPLIRSSSFSFFYTLGSSPRSETKPLPAGECPRAHNTKVGRT
jgi:hypothetical protein